MTVKIDSGRTRYEGNGVTVDFSTEFEYLANSHVRVIHTMTNGIERELVENVDYTLTSSKSGTASGPGNVRTISGVVPPGAFLTILRNVPFTQPFDGEILSTADAQDLEIGYDRVWEGMQQLKEGLSRAVLASPGSGGVAQNLAWSPVLAAVTVPDPKSIVLQVVDWIGGNATPGPKPPVGMYIGMGGFVSNPADAVNIQGQSGGGGSGAGDLLAEQNLMDVANRFIAAGNLQILATPVDNGSENLALDSFGGDVIYLTSGNISGISLAPGRQVFVRFANSFTIEHNANIRLPGYASITTQMDDWALFIGGNSGQTHCAFYMLASGQPLVQPSIAGLGLGTASLKATEDFLQTANNLSELPDKAAARTNLALGAAATRNVGPGIGNLVEIVETSDRLPVLDGRNLYNLPIPAVSQPVPTSSVYLVGTFMLLGVNGDADTVGYNQTVSGSALYMPAFTLMTISGVSFYGINVAQADVPSIIRPAGTWMNVSGHVLASTAKSVAYFVRTG